MSAFTTAAWFCDAAHMSAVSPNHCSRALTSAPRLMSACTASTLPVRAAVMRTGSPASVRVLGSAPASIKAPSTLALPLVAASVIGWMP